MYIEVVKVTDMITQTLSQQLLHIIIFLFHRFQHNHNLAIFLWTSYRSFYYVYNK